MLFVAIYKFLNYFSLVITLRQISGQKIHTNHAPCIGKSLIIKELPLQGAALYIYIKAQGSALGYVEFGLYLSASRR